MAIAIEKKTKTKLCLVALKNTNLALIPTKQESGPIKHIQQNLIILKLDTLHSYFKLSNILNRK